MNKKIISNLKIALNEIMLEIQKQSGKEKDLRLFAMAYELRQELEKEVYR